MSKTIRFEMLGDIAIFRLVESASFDRTVRQVVSVIESARSQHLDKLMIVGSARSRYASPSIPSRHQAVRKGAAAASGMQIAVVTRSEIIDPQRFGVVAATNFGANVNVFVSEDEALAWFHENE
jgi:hypothetical protein